jgi:hypothetical protein
MARSHIDWTPILRYEYYLLAATDKRPLGFARQLWREWKRLFRSKAVISQQPEAKVLFFKSMPRSDYNTFFRSVFECCPEPNKRYVDFQLERCKFINLRALRIAIGRSFYIWRMMDCRWPGKLWLFPRLVRYLEFQQSAEALTCAWVVVFADMQPYDNLLVQTLKASGTESVTLQHGLYVDYTEQDNINTINYKNVVSDYFLSWGEDTTAPLQLETDISLFGYSAKPSLGVWN